jgi:transcriptional regulator with GAF, ATPase, and Fis domain
MMTDREHAELSLLRDLLALRTGNPLELTSTAIHRLRIATAAELACLELHDAGRRFECLATRDGCDPERTRAHVAAAVVQAARAQAAPFVISQGTSAIACVPINDPDAGGHVYLVSRGVFVARDLALAAAFSNEIREVAHVLLGGQRDLHARTHAFQMRCIHDTLQRCQGNTSAAARLLGVPRSFLYRLRGRDRSRVSPNETDR